MYLSSQFGRLKLEFSAIREEKSDQSFELEGRIFSEPQLMRKKMGQTLGRVNLPSWVALMDGQPVRIYACQSEAQAGFIAQLSEDPELGHYFPTTYIHQKVFLVVAWVEGRSITWKEIGSSDSLLDQLTKIQVALHRRSETGHVVAECYYLRFLKDRLQRFRGVFPLDDGLSLLSEYLQTPPDIEARVSHPDIQADNLILETDTHRLKLIDNELLTYSRHYLIDLFNSHLSFIDELGPDFLGIYLQSYVRNGGDLGPLLEHERYFQALWYLRLIGTALQDGNIASAFRYSQEIAAGFPKLHPLIQLARERCS